MVIPKKQVFWAIIKIFKDIFSNRSVNYALSKSAKIVLLESIFYVKNQLILFKKKSFKIINLVDHVLVKTFFLGIFKNIFLRIKLILGQKSYFLGATIFEIPQPN